MVEHIINSPQKRCQSAKQVGLQISRGRVADRRAVGKLSQMTGHATVKVLVASVVLVLGTDRYSTDRRCRLPAMVEIAKQWCSWQHLCIISHVKQQHSEILSFITFVQLTYTGIPIRIST